MSQTSEEMNDLRPRMVRVEHDLTDHHRRISALEEWRHQVEVADARGEEKFKGMEEKFNAEFSTLKESVKSITADLKRILWMVIGGIVMGIVAFILKGGLNIP